MPTIKNFSRFLASCLIIGCVIVLSHPVAIHSQPDENPLPANGSPKKTAKTRNFSLKQAMEIAQAANLDVLLSEERINEAMGKADVARSELLPMFDAVASERRLQRNADAIGLSNQLPITVPSTIGPYNLFDGRVTGKFSLINLSAIQNWRAAKANRKLSEQELAAAREEAMMFAASLYLEAARNQEALKVAEADIKRNERLLQLAKDKKKAGTGIDLDVMRAEVELSKSLEEKEVAQMETKRSLLELTNALGIDLADSVQLSDELSLTAVKAIDFEAARALAMKQRPDLIAQRQRELVAARKKDAAAAEWLPVLEAFGDYGENGKEFDETTEVWTVGGQFTLPIWDSFKRHGNYKQNKSQLKQAENRTLELKRSIETQIRIGLEELESKKNQVRVAKETLRLTEKELDLANDRYKAGTGTNIEVIKAQAQVSEAEFRVVQNLYEYNLVRVNWFKTLGKIFGATE